MKLRHVVVLVSGLVVGVTSLLIARHAPDGSLAGPATAAGLWLLGVGWALVACGVVAWARRPSSRFGLLLASAGSAWLLVELDNPGVGSPLLFSIGLLAYSAAPALVAHAALAYPDGRVAGALERGGLVVAYASAVVALGVVPALAYDPVAEGCLDCPRNLVHVAGSPALVEASSSAGLVAGIVWAAALALLALVRIARSSPAARLLTGPVLLALAAYLALVAVQYGHSRGRGFLSNDAMDRRLWIAQGAALALLTGGVALAWARSLRARTSVARLVIELSAEPAPGQLRDALAAALGDPELEIAYPLDSGEHVDGDGRPIELADGGGRVTTRLVRGGRPVAVIRHRTDLRDDPGLIEDVGAAATLALDHERLQAQARSQLEQLRASRARTVAASDAERRRLERDLHDGAQQRLVVLSFALQLLRAQLGGDAAEAIGAAETELRAALRELRELANGIYPAVLIDEGLASAIEALAETGAVPIQIAALPAERLDPAVEAAAYFLVAAIARRATVAAVNVRARHADGCLLVEIDSADADADGDLVELEDRIGALDGELAVQRVAGGSTRIRAEVPCAS